MLEWKDVVAAVVSSLGSDPSGIACVLEFLHVLPEEVTEGRKINLTVRPTTLLPAPELLLNRRHCAQDQSLMRVTIGG